MRDALATLLASASRDELSRVLKVRGVLLDRAIEASGHLVEGTAPLMPAWQRYSGVVWTHLDPASLDDEKRRRILVPSGLYGISCGTDAIGDYRLTMKVGLGGLGNVGRFWRPSLTRVLEGLDEACFVDLLPKEHASALDPRGRLSERVVSVAFVRHDGEGVAGHDAKAAKGILARRILEGGLESVGGFRWRGWRGRIHRGRYEVRAPRVLNP